MNPAEHPIPSPDELRKVAASLQRELETEEPPSAATLATVITEQLLAFERVHGAPPTCTVLWAFTLAPPPGDTPAAAAADTDASDTEGHVLRGQRLLLAAEDNKVPLASVLECLFEEILRLRLVITSQEDVEEED